MGQASPLLTPGTQQLTEQRSAVASGTGTATFTFASPPSGFIKSGSLQCLAAPSGAVFLAVIGATQWGDWAGNSVGGPVQATANEQLVVTATGLVAGTTYLMSWIGSLDQEGMVQPEWPDPNSSVIAAAIAGALAVQGVVELLLNNLSIPLTGGAQTLIFSDPTPAHLYSTVLVVVQSQSAAPQTFTADAILGGAAPVAAFPSQTQSLVSASSPLVFALPVAITTSDDLEVTLTSVNTCSVFVSIYGLTEQGTQQVIAPVGMPLDTYEVGGKLTATGNVPASSSVQLLAAPPAGFVYRLHSFTGNGMAGTIPLILANTAFTALYASVNLTIPSMQLNGQIAPGTVSCFNGGAAAGQACAITYDLIPAQTLQ